MTYVKINDNLYPAIITGKVSNSEWDGRATKAITLEMDYETAKNLFVDGIAWSIVQKNEFIVEEPIYDIDENGELAMNENRAPIQIGTQPRTEVQELVFDNSEYMIAGDITDHRDGTTTITMGKLTELEEAYEIMFGGAE